MTSAQRDVSAIRPAMERKPDILRGHRDRLHESFAMYSTTSSSPRLRNLPGLLSLTVT
jgi:hypothetical protein